jgi:plastocyanin
VSRRRLTRLAVALAPLLGVLGPGAAAPAPSTHTVRMEATTFQPADVTVRVGDTVAWRNEDPFPHTATSTAFDSKVVPAGGSWRYTPRAKGSYPYVCTLHPTMKGTLRVE